MLDKISLLGILVSIACATGCSPKLESEARLVTNASRETAAPILGGFDRLHPKTQVHREFGDLNSIATQDLDCVWDVDFSAVLKMQKEGLLKKHQWNLPSNWPENYRAKDGTWVAIAPEALVILVNVERLPDPEQRPVSILDAATDRWGKRTQFPLNGNARLNLLLEILRSHAARIALPTELTEEPFNKNGHLDFENWRTQLQANQQQDEPNATAIESVVQGNLDWAITTSSVALSAKESGAPVEIVFPDQFSGGFGTILIPQAIAIAQSVKSPNVANALSKYLTSESVESRMVMGNAGCIPVHPASKEEARLKGANKVRWAQVDFERIFAD